MPTRHVTGAALALVLAATSSAGCRHPAPVFSESNARAHINTLAGAIGSRPAGTDANRRAREYITDQLRFYGFTVRIQEAEASWPEAGLSAHVWNVIGILPGERPDAIGLVAHYDSRPETPGAGDDATGVAVVLESARQLAASGPRRHSVLALLTDAEEDGLLGARALVGDPEVRSRLKAFVNVEAAGSDAPAVLFQAGPENGWLLRAWAAAAPSPFGSSYFSEIYRRLPNDTDYTVLARAGVPGLNFAAIGDGYAYHAPGDGPDRVTRDLLAHMGSNVLATALALDSVDITRRTTEEPIFFDVAGRRAIVISPTASRVLSFVAIVLGIMVVARTARAVVTIATRAAAWRAAGWGIAGTLAMGGALVGVCALLRGVREVYHPWYAHPTRLWVCLGLTIVLVTTVVARIARRSPGWLAVPAHPATAWTATLPFWIALTIAAEAFVPTAAYLWSVPLLAAALVLLPLAPFRGPLAALAAVAVLIVSASIWLAHGVTLLQFAVPTFGRLPMVTPLAAYPALCLAIALMILPPVVALLAAVTRPVPLARTRMGRALDALVVSASTTAVVASFAWCYLAAAYTPARPMVRTAQYVADHARGTAVWEVGSNEPGLDLQGNPAVRWTRVGSAAPLIPEPPVDALPMPFRFRAAAGVAPAPAQVAGRWSERDDAMEVEITAHLEQDRLLVAVLLPPGIVPQRSSQPGVVRHGWWTMARAGAAAGPVTFGLTLPANAAAALPGVRVVVSEPGGMPLVSGGRAAPAASAAEAWRTREIHVLPVAWTRPLR